MRLSGHRGGTDRRYFPWATLVLAREQIFEGELKITGCHARFESLSVSERRFDSVSLTEFGKKSGSIP
jgi:hypothetical protein